MASENSVGVSSRIQKFTVIDNLILEKHLRNIGPVGFSLWCCLRKFADYQNGTCYPKMATLSEMMGVGRSTIIRTLSQLVDQGFLEVESGAGKGKANHYTVTFPGNGVVQIETGGCVNLTQGVVQIETGGVSPAVHPNKEETIPINNNHLTLAPPSSDRVPTTESKPKKKQSTADPRREAFIAHLSKGYKLKGWKFYFNGKDGVQLDNLLKGHRDMTLEDFNTCLKNYFKSEGSIPGDEPYAYLAKLPRYHHGPLNQYGKLMDCAPAGVEL